MDGRNVAVLLDVRRAVDHVRSGGRRVRQIEGEGGEQESGECRAGEQEPSRVFHRIRARPEPAGWV